MNLIKTPQELLYEQAGIPHMKSGGKTTDVTNFVQFFEREYNRKLTPKELSHVYSHFNSMKSPALMKQALLNQDFTNPNTK